MGDDSTRVGPRAHDAADEGGEVVPQGRPRSRQDAEQARLQALQEAAAQARRDRKNVQQKMRELEREELERPASEGIDVEARRAASKRCTQEAEAQHLKALQAAS